MWKKTSTQYFVVNEWYLLWSVHFQVDNMPQQKYPVYLFIHGGGYQTGSGNMGYAELFKAFTSTGIIVVSINYQSECFWWDLKAFMLIFFLTGSVRAEIRGVSQICICKLGNIKIFSGRYENTVSSWALSCFSNFISWFLLIGAESPSPSSHGTPIFDKWQTHDT